MPPRAAVNSPEYTGASGVPPMTCAACLSVMFPRPMVGLGTSVTFLSAIARAPSVTHCRSPATHGDLKPPTGHVARSGAEYEKPGVPTPMNRPADPPFGGVKPGRSPEGRAPRNQ